MAVQFLITNGHSFSDIQNYTLKQFELFIEILTIKDNG